MQYIVSIWNYTPLQYIVNTENLIYRHILNSVESGDILDYI